jgi:uncharacterized protein
MKATLFRLRVLFSLAVILAVFNCLSADARGIPVLNARVNDNADMLSSGTEKQLESMLAALEQEESTQLAVLTIPSLEGESLEEFSLKVVEKWRLGRQGLDNGALLLVAKEERKIRIEVGYGLEGALTDLESGQIIRNIITPRFRNGNFDGGVIDGVTAMVAAVRGEFKEQDFAGSPKGAGSELSSFMIFIVFILFNIGRILYRNRLLAGGLGALAASAGGAIFFKGQWLLILGLIPVGFLAGFLASMFISHLNLRPSGRRGGTYGSSSGGFGGGFGSSGGGFGGGGGGFGGGGSSGGW